MTLKITFRTDASLTIGTGHVMRCLTLAMALKRKGAEVLFVSREHPGHLCEEIAALGFMVVRLPAMSGHHANETGGEVNLPAHAHWLGASWQHDAEETRQTINNTFSTADWLIVDHYALDARWEAALRPHTNRLMVIDDLADRTHDCDVLLDQNYSPHPTRRYEALIPPHCRRLLGPRYALLRPEFADLRRRLRDRDGSIRNILVFFGGSDPGDETTKALLALRQVMADHAELEAEIVVGAANTQAERIARLCGEFPRMSFHRQVDTMAELIHHADLAIGAGGVTSWERCALGLPALVSILAENQRAGMESLAAAGAIINLGDAAQVSGDDLARAVRELLVDPARCRSLSRQALAIMGNEVKSTVEQLLRMAVPHEKP